MARAGDVLEHPRTGELIVWLKVAGDTDGRLLEGDIFARPGGHPAATHVHPHQEERFRVVHGTVRLEVDGTERILGAGATASVPPGRAHTWANVGDDPFWTGHPLAQANLYAFGRLAWEPHADPAAVLDEWIGLTFGAGDASLRRTLHLMMDDSWRTYERYTAPLGVGFMVRPGHHYGPDVDGYEYTRWGTYHFADRDGIGVDRTRATGTGFTGQYPLPWSELYESVRTCPDELLLFFHHVPYDHVLHDGSTVIQHIYDSHFAGAEQAAKLADLWSAVPVKGLLCKAFHVRVADLLTEQIRSAREWRDQINAYFWRKSGVPDQYGRRLDGLGR